MDVIFWPLGVFTTPGLHLLPAIFTIVEFQIFALLRYASGAERSAK